MHLHRIPMNPASTSSVVTISVIKNEMRQLKEKTIVNILRYYNLYKTFDGITTHLNSNVDQNLFRRNNQLGSKENKFKIQKEN